jgi:hypothetical protein
MGREMVKTASLRAWVALTIVAVLMLTFSGAALAAPPFPVPNSGASLNCAATTSGVLYSRKHGAPLGQDISAAVPKGGQREYVQKALQETC